VAPVRDFALAGYNAVFSLATARNCSHDVAARSL
jgi:hypothetical protein